MQSTIQNKNNVQVTRPEHAPLPIPTRPVPVMPARNPRPTTASTKSIDTGAAESNHPTTGNASEASKTTSRNALDSKATSNNERSAEILMIELADLPAANCIQSRAAMDEDQVDHYALLLAENVVLPPINIFSVDDKFVVVDGMHRIEASRLTGKKEIAAYITTGTKADALRAALRANGTHGLARTAADKRRVVQLALGDPNIAKLSSRQIAELCIVSKTLVDDVRNDPQLVATDSSAPRIGKDGKTRKGRTANTAKVENVGASSSIIPSEDSVCDKDDANEPVEDRADETDYSPPASPSENIAPWPQTKEFLDDVSAGLTGHALQQFAKNLREYGDGLIS